MESKDPIKKLSLAKETPRLSRVVIYPKDIQLLTGKSYRHALYLNQEIRAYFKKKSHQLLTIYEFSEYTGIGIEIIFSHLK
ncbi:MULTISPECIES: hypothetical protein [Aequorivita]|uniref:Uncharacterized protein n=1 Tax=Aequorivita iocasae TaxID=2803865 RepID=A0ABX7DQB5_9FLAO|nr:MULTISPECIES: hypothetical protein [Aequorivita]QQX76030.1 hypothetical protein JK629_11880 [Aequorivita iocasae]UCA55490.1 hypothetical protein LDL78_11935 [Aequorivita sp. F7]